MSENNVARKGDPGIKIHFTALDAKSYQVEDDWNGQYEVTVTRADGRGMSDHEVATILKRSLSGRRMVPVDEINAIFH